MVSYVHHKPAEPTRFQWPQNQCNATVNWDWTNIPSIT